MLTPAKKNKIKSP